MIEPFGFARACGSVALGILLAGAAFAQQPAPTTAKPASLSTSAPRLSAGAPNSSSASAPNEGVPGANSDSAPGARSAPPAAKAAASAQEEAALLIEGEQRFATNCGRCHQAPHKFPPRMMATIVRHMRVRATITDEDMRLILRYMTQ